MTLRERAQASSRWRERRVVRQQQGQQRQHQQQVANRCCLEWSRLLQVMIAKDALVGLRSALAVRRGLILH